MSKPDQFKNFGNGKIIFEIFPDEYLALNRELCTQKHPKLQNILAQCGAEDIDMKLAQIASYCSVVMDGCYTLEDRIKLCKILKEKLILLREPEVAQTIILFPN